MTWNKTNEMKWNQKENQNKKKAEREHNIVEQIKTNEMKINKTKQKKTEKRNKIKRTNLNRIKTNKNKTKPEIKQNKNESTLYIYTYICIELTVYGSYVCLSSSNLRDRYSEDKNLIIRIK